MHSSPRRAKLVRHQKNGQDACLQGGIHAFWESENTGADTMATLTITSINCRETSNGSGADDLYILLNGQKVFSAEVDEGENPQVNFQTSFTKHAIIQVWEDDSGSDDDFLGEHHVQGRAALRAGWGRCRGLIRTASPSRQGCCFGCTPVSVFRPGSGGREVALRS